MECPVCHGKGFIEDRSGRIWTLDPCPMRCPAEQRWQERAGDILDALGEPDRVILPEDREE